MQRITSIRTRSLRRHTKPLLRSDLMMIINSLETEPGRRNRHLLFSVFVTDLSLQREVRQGQGNYQEQQQRQDCGTDCTCSWSGWSLSQGERTGGISEWQHKPSAINLCDGPPSTPHTPSADLGAEEGVSPGVGDREQASRLALLAICVVKSSEAPSMASWAD